MNERLRIAGGKVKYDKMLVLIKAVRFNGVNIHDYIVKTQNITEGVELTFILSDISLYCN